MAACSKARASVPRRSRLSRQPRRSLEAAAITSSVWPKSGRRVAELAVLERRVRVAELELCKLGVEADSSSDSHSGEGGGTERTKGSTKR